MIKQKFATQFLGKAFAILCLFATRPAIADSTGVDNNIYTLNFNQTPVPSPSSLEFIATDLTTGDTQTKFGFTLADRYQSLFGFTALPDGTFASSSSNLSGGSTYLYLFGATERTLTVSGLPTKSAYIISLLGLKDGTLLALVNPKNAGNSPFLLDMIDLQSGAAIDTGFPFKSDRSLSGLTQCPDGTIYALASAPNESKSLVRLDLEQKQLIDGPTLMQSGQRPVNIYSLACSPPGILFALGVRNSDANAGEGSFLPTDLFKVDNNTGELTTFRQPFQTAGGIAFVPKTSPALNSLPPETTPRLRRNSAQCRNKPKTAHLSIGPKRAKNLPGNI